MKPHTRKDIDEELATLRVHVRAMGARCIDSLRIAMGGLEADGSDAPSRTIELDRHINNDEIELDRQVFEAFALQQPLAQDLRLLAATFKLTTDLERIGDEAVDIAKSAPRARGPALPIVRSDLQAMYDEASGMLDDAVRSFVERDAELATRVVSRDEKVDRVYAHVLDRVAEHSRAHPDDVPALLHVLDVARNLERVADHATNIAEETIFAVRGEDTRHDHAQNHTG